MNVTGVPADVDTSRSDVPEVATTPRSELGVFTPTFDSRSEISAASNEPIASLSPRTDPVSTIAGDIEVPVLPLDSVLALSTNPEIPTERGLDISEATSETSIESIPPSSPLHDVTPVSTPTQQDSTSQSSLTMLAPVSLPSTHIVCDVIFEFMPSVCSRFAFQSAHTIPNATPASAKDAPASEPVHVTIAEDTAFGVQRVGTTVTETRKEFLSLSGDSTPQKPESDLLSNASERSGKVTGSEFKTPSPPTAIPLEVDVDQSSKGILKKVNDVIPPLDTNQVVVPSPSQVERSECGAERAASSSHVNEQFPSVERLVFPVYKYS